MLSRVTVRGGSVYWGRKEARASRGIVVLFAWVTVEDRQLRNFVDLYSSLGWNSLVCRADFLNLFYPERALSLAFFVIDELLEELRLKPCPIVFTSFSGASKASLYKVFQVIGGACKSHLYQTDYHIVRNCLCGHIFDSGPVEFTSDLSAQFALHPAILKIPGSSKLFTWFAKGVASGLDALYLTNFDMQRTEYWRSLCSSVNFDAPFLIICSEEDDIATYQIVRKFTQRIQEHEVDVKLVKFNGSLHLGHYENNPIQYRAAVTNLLEMAVSVYSQRSLQSKEQRSGLECMNDEISELICDLQTAAVNSNQSLRRVAVGPDDHFFLPSSAESQNVRESGPLREEQKERSNCLINPPSISAHSILGQFLFDVCVPKNVEGWDIKFSGSLNGQPLASARRRSPFQGIKRIGRSRL